MKNKLLLLVFIAISFLGFSQVNPLPPRPAVIPQLAPFYHGVASGDPLSDRVIIWTRVTPQIDSVVTVNWQMALDTAFSNIINSGTVTTDTGVDYTVKLDVTGLQQNTWYYYRFNTGGVYSIPGRTRTLPSGHVDSLRFAVFSCSDFQSGFFNAYHDIASRNDLDAVLHLGDYYYEYKAGGSDYQNDTSRLHPAGHDASTLADYRLWHSQYKLDQDMRDIFQQYPWIQIWDDHDVANNSWRTGAQNHNPATQGSWFDRKAAAFKAYFEWLPIRESAPGNDSIIRRSFKWGDLLNLIMLDTRLEGRDSSLGSGISTTNALLADTNRNMLGPAQLAWLKTQLSDTSVQWRIIGSQVMIAPLITLGTVFNGDQWDGYPAERKRVFDYIMKNKIKDVVFLSGDIHSSWATDLAAPDSTYVAASGAGCVATEFIGSSITSTATGLSAILAILQSLDPYFKYAEATLRGYLLFDVNKQRAQGDFIHMNTVASRKFRSENDAQWMNLDGERHLRPAPLPLDPSRGGNPPLLPLVDNVNVGIKNVNADNMIIISCFPNPTANEVAIQYYLSEPLKVNMLISDMFGKVLYNSGLQVQNGLFTNRISLEGFAAGTYVVSITSSGKTYSRQIIKAE